ncbi:MAG: hypothetical protein U1E35_02025 [Rhodospirillales bacterium]
MFFPMIAAVVVLALPAVAAAADQPAGAEAPSAESDLGIVAAAVRVTGARCQQPSRLEPDPAAGLADRPAWIITCEGGRFRVIFEGDTGPRVTPLD